MRICSGLLCDRKAKVWMRGKAWCIPCSIKRFGIVALPPDGAAPGSGSPDPLPSSEGRASASASVGVSEPAPLSLADLDIEWIVENDGVRELEWEVLTEHGLLVRPFLAARLEDGTV